MNPKCFDQSDQDPVPGEYEERAGMSCEECGSPQLRTTDDEGYVQIWCPFANAEPCIECEHDHATRECDGCTLAFCKEHLTEGLCKECSRVESDNEV
jgi:hypothetical protein